MMTSSTARRVLLGTAAALVAVALTSSPVMAASWSGPRVYTNDFSHGGQLVALTKSKLLVAYSTGEMVGNEWVWGLRRSTDAGRSWSGLIGAGPGEIEIAGSGAVVDRVRLVNDRLWYSRSTNSGASFGNARALTARDARVIDFELARGLDSTVAVVWREFQGSTYSRVSSDGGLTFGDKRLVTTAGKVELDDLAVGDGVIYVSYVRYLFNQGNFPLAIRRSDDGGESWGAAHVLSQQGERSSLAAQGDEAYVSYTEWEFGETSSATFSTVHIRSTADSGGSWSEPRTLPPTTWDSEQAVIALRNGVLHALFNRCDVDWDICDNSRLYYRRSIDGLSWSNPERVTPISDYGTYVTDMSVVGDRVFAAYSAYTLEADYGGLHVRAP